MRLIKGATTHQGHCQQSTHSLTLSWGKRFKFQAFFGRRLVYSFLFSLQKMALGTSPLCFPKGLVALLASCTQVVISLIRWREADYFFSLPCGARIMWREKERKEGEMMSKLKWDAEPCTMCSEAASNRIKSELGETSTGGHREVNIVTPSNLYIIWTILCYNKCSYILVIKK